MSTSTPKYMFAGATSFNQDISNWHTGSVKDYSNFLKGNEFILKPEPAPPVRWKRPAGYQNDN